MSLETCAVSLIMKSCMKQHAQNTVLENVCSKASSSKQPVAKLSSLRCYSRDGENGG